MEETKEVSISEADPTRTIRVGKNLPPADTTPVCQKRIPLDPVREDLVKAEVNKLTTNDFLRESYYSVGLANLVLVLNPNGTRRMYIDFTDVNKACPKDYFLLPRIDQTVDSTSGSRGIEANPEKIKAFIGMPSPKKHKDVQSVIGHIAALSWFILKSTDKSHAIRVITNHPLRQVSIKGHALADYVVECTSFNHFPKEPVLELPTWKVHVDDVSNEKGARAGVILISPQEHQFQSALRFGFFTSNNKAENEAMLASLKLAKELFSCSLATSQWTSGGCQQNPQDHIEEEALGLQGPLASGTPSSSRGLSNNKKSFNRAHTVWNGLGCKSVIPVETMIPSHRRDTYDPSRSHSLL
uniref:RNase H type-1 domain-containing protein n=1 Tax=Cannabis sativa TaxID=3483 RepID=A0A803QGU8_CANSA